MELSHIIALFAVGFALASLHQGMHIARELQRRGRIAHPLLTRFMIFKYMADYKRITVVETGNDGPLYNRVAMLFLIAAILAFITLAITFA